MSGQNGKKLNKEATYFIISDAHVGTHNSRDFCNYSKLVPFLKDVYMNTHAVLILNGDFFDFSRSAKTHVIEKNPEIFDLLSELEKNERLIKIKGNHDSSINGEKQLSLNNSILVLHGDIFERTTCLFPWLKVFLDWGISLVETVFKTHINRLLKKIFGYDRVSRRGRKIETKALEYLKNHPQYQAIIVGHSHTPKSDGKYHNSGCFTETNADYIEITDTNIQLKSY